MSSRVAGIDVVSALIVASDDLMAIVPVEHIKMGLLPEGTPIPNLLLETVSTIEHQTLAGDEPEERITERIAVKVRARSHRERRTLIDLLRQATRGRVGDIAGARSCSVLLAGTGPDMIGPNNSFDRTQDLRVSLVRDA